MKIFKWYIYLMCCFTNSNVISQEMFSVFRNSMLITENADTVYSSNVMDSLFTIEYYDSDGLRLSQVKYSLNGQIQLYSVSEFKEHIPDYGLSRVKWLNDTLIYYSFYGPGSYFKFWKLSANGHVEIGEVNSLNRGFGVVHDKENNIIVKKVYKGIKYEILEYYPNGIIKREYEMINGLDIELGIYKEFNEKGVLIVQGNYLDYSELLDNDFKPYLLKNGVKNGLWKYYNNNILFKEETWIMGEKK